MNNHTAYTGQRDPINAPCNQPEPMSEQPQEGDEPISTMAYKLAEHMEKQQPQEWTPENICEVCGFVSAEEHNFYSSLGELIRKICEIHKAEIAAERNSFAELSDSTGKEMIRLREGFQKQLAAEKQATSNAFTRGYDQGYADATAVEWERADKTMETWPGFNDWRRQHDERIRQPLVEALRQIATIEANDPDEVAAGLKQTQSYQIAADALAKEGK